MGPDNDFESYFAFAKACEEHKLEGLARWNMRKKRYIGALRAESGYLKIITLRYPEEVVDASELPRPSGRPFEKQEMRMAEQLVSALEGDFNPEEYRDEYRQRVMEFLEKKAKGGTVKFRKVEEKKPKVVPLSDLLEKSLHLAAKEKKSA